MRGWSPIARTSVFPEKGSPAYAGMVLSLLSCSYLRLRFPRVCGDGPSAVKWAFVLIKVPPRMRGWSLPCLSQHGTASGSPAYAGMVPTMVERNMVATRFPRVCGDGPCLIVWPSSTPLVPPRMRGWSHHHARSERSSHGSPAYAGMVPPGCHRAVRCLWFPRVCGDGPEEDDPYCDDHMVPPRMRGWSRCPLCRGANVLGSPAYAGMVPWSAP